MKTWSRVETDILHRYYGNVTNDKLYALIPNKTPIAIYKKARKLGLKISEEIRFQNRSNAKSGEKCNFWNGGRGKTTKGYTVVLQPDHPRADSHGYVLEHIVVFEQATGLSVPQGCCIHHLNGIKDDNRIENLCMMTHCAHTVMHHKGKKRTDETKQKMSGRMKTYAE